MFKHPKESTPFEHLLNDEPQKFEQIDFVVQELKINGKVVWIRKKEIIKEKEESCLPC